MIAARPRTPIQACLLDPLCTIGPAAHCTLIRDVDAFVCFAGTRLAGARTADCLEPRLVDVGNPVSIAGDEFRGERFGAVMSCKTSRT